MMGDLPLFGLALAALVGFGSYLVARRVAERLGRRRAAAEAARALEGLDRAGRRRAERATRKSTRRR